MFAAALAAAASLVLVEGPVAPLERPPDGMVVADFDGDGRDDVLVSRLRGLDLVRAGRRGFERRTPALSLPQPADQLSAGDFDGDGRLDVAARLSGGVMIARGDGKGRFTEHQRHTPVDYLWGLRTFRGAIYLHFRDRVEILGRGISYPLPLDAELAVGDLDRDGHGDLAWRAGGGTEVSTALARGDGYAAGPTADVCAGGRGMVIHEGMLVSTCREHPFRACDAELRCAPPPDGPAADAGLHVGDFDGDSRPDVAVGDLGQGWIDGDPRKGYDAGERVLVFRGLGGIAFAEPVHAPADRPSWIAAGDFDGNGRDDLVALGQLGSRLAPLLSSPSRWRTRPARSRARLLGRRFPIAPADGAARIPIGCSRGRGRCQVVVGLGQTLVSYSVAPGERVTRPLPLASIAGAQVTLSVRDQLARWTRRVRLVSPTRAERRDSCLRGRVIARGRAGTVMRIRRYLYACEFSDGRHRPLGFDAHGPVAIAGERVAFGHASCIADTGECRKEVTVADLRSPVQRPPGRFGASDPELACRGHERTCADGVRTVVLGRAGGAAWITCVPDGNQRIHPCSRAPGPVAVVRLDSRGLRVLDRGPGLRGLRLSATGRSVTWRSGGRTRRAAIGSAA